jgi:hypothetical protein
MQLLGITIRKPSFGEITATSVLAIGLWLVGVGAMVQSGQVFGRADLAALLVMVWWGCLAARVGIDLRAGWRHLVAGAVVGSLLLGANGVVWAVLG